MDMEKMQMPDMAAPDYPSRYRFLKATEDFHLELPKKLRQYYDSFAKDSATMPPTGALVPQITGAGRANLTNYTETVMSLERAFNEMYDTGTRLAPLAHGALQTSQQGQRAINDVIVIVNGAAGSVPKEGMTEDDHILNYVTQALQEADRIMKDAITQHENAGRGVDNETSELQKLKDRLKALETENSDLKKRLADPADVTQPPYTTPPGTTPPAVDQNPLPTGLDGLGTDGLGNTGLDGLSPNGVDNSGVSDQLSRAIDNLQNSPSAATPGTPAVQQPASAMSSPAGSGMDMLGSMLPMLMQQAMMRNMADQDLNDRRAELDPQRFEDELAPVTPPPVAAPVTAQPATAQPAVSAPATHPTQQTGTPSAQPAASAPGRTPGADGSVLYTFPDGRTQKVSAIVAQALDAAFGNASGTDAQTAYAKTPAKWSDKKQIGERVDPYQLMTGDVATWDKRTAILVVFGSDEGGTLEAVVNGQLTPFTAEMSDSAGEFGQFSGFVHPKGIELTAPADTGATPSTPSVPDQSAATAVPVVAAPTV